LKNLWPELTAQGSRLKAQGKKGFKLQCFQLSAFSFALLYPKALKFHPGRVAHQTPESLDHCAL
jgi:hypothetical protein